MTIKIQCPCGIKYAFDVESPAKIQFICQSCGLDSSAVVNQIIQQQFALTQTATTEPPTASTTAAGIPSAAKPRVHINLSSDKKAAAPAPKSAVHLASQKPEPPAEAEQASESNAANSESSDVASGQTCLKHAGEPIMGACLVCKKPLCSRCMELFGYVCSAYCQAQAERLHIDVPVYGQQKAVVEAHYWRKVRAIALSILTLVLVLLGLWAWYANFLSHPKVVFSLALPPADYLQSECKLVGPDQALVRQGNKLTRYDLKKKAEVWSVQLLDKKQIEAAAAEELAERKAWAEKWKAEMAKLKKSPRRFVNEDGDEITLPDTLAETDEEDPKMLNKSVEASLLSKIKLHLDGKELWVVFHNKLAHFNWDTGKPDKDIPVPEKIKHVEARDQSLFFISQTQTGREIFTRITLPGGEVQTEQGPEPRQPEKIVPSKTNAPALAKANTNAVKTAKSVVAPRTTPIKGALTAAAQAGRAAPAEPSAADDDFMDVSRTQYIFAGDNIARLTVKLLEKKVVAYQAMKEAPKTSALERVSGANVGEAMNEIVNEWERDRTGGKRMEDESRYGVTIQRILAQGAPEWTGEVNGPPELFALKSVDVLVGGKTLVVLDKSNKKLWEGKLAYPIARHFDMETALWQLGELENNPPCVEREQRLYFYDQGVLAAYDLATGNAHWRFTSVGINKLAFDQQGMLYVATTSAGADTLQYSGQVDLGRKIVPVILKVDPRNGKILWRMNQMGEKFVLTGKFLYTVESDASRTDPLLMMPGGGSHCGIYRLDPSNGRELWHHFEKRAAFDTDFAGTTALLLFNSEMEVLRFFSL